MLHNGLLLLDKNVPVSLVLLSKNWYSRLCCSIKSKGILGKCFQVLSGVRQGKVLSPYLFGVYVDDLIADLRNSSYGIHVGSLFAGCLFHADDIVLLSPTCYGLQRLVNIC